MFISKLMLSQTAWTPVWLPWLLWCSLKTSEYGGSAFLEFGQNLILTVSGRCRVGGCLKRFSVNGAPDVFCEGKVGRMRVRPGWRLAALRLQFCMVLLKHSFCPQNPQLSISCVLLPRPHTARDAGLIRALRSSRSSVGAFIVVANPIMLAENIMGPRRRMLVRVPDTHRFPECLCRRRGF